MKPGDVVVFLADRQLYGPGIYTEATVDGMMVVEFSDGTSELFFPHELDTPDRAYLSAA